MTYEEFVEAAMTYLHGQLDNESKEKFEQYIESHAKAREDLEMLSFMKAKFEDEERGDMVAIWQQIEASLDSPIPDPAESPAKARPRRSRPR